MRGGFVEWSSKVAARCADLSHAGSLDPQDEKVGTGVAGSLSEGDCVRMQLRMEGETIQIARFKAFGCGGTIASASLASEWAEGRSLSEAEAIQSADLSAALGLSPQRARCAELPLKALKEAIQDVRDKQRFRAGGIKKREAMAASTRRME